MGRPVNSNAEETADISRALRRAAKRALELGIKTGTPVYVIRNDEIVDLTTDKKATKKSRKAVPDQKSSAK
jgi:hypothetical protein